jgi:hypothetical protein
MTDKEKLEQILKYFAQYKDIKEEDSYPDAWDSGNQDDYAVAVADWNERHTATWIRDLILERKSKNND